MGGWRIINELEISNTSRRAHTFFIKSLSISIQWYNGQDALLAIIHGCFEKICWKISGITLIFKISQRGCQILQFLHFFLACIYSVSCHRKQQLLMKLLKRSFKDFVFSLQKILVFVGCSLKSFSNALFLYSISQRVFAQHSKLKCWIYKHVHRITDASSVQLISGLICHLNLKQSTFSGSESRISKDLMEVTMWDESCSNWVGKQMIQG